MTEDDDIWYVDDEKGARSVPLYVLVGGRTRPRNTQLDLATQVVALPTDTAALEPEYREIVDCCRRWLAIAEVAAYVNVPLTVAKVMVDVLIDRGFLAVGSPAQSTIPDRELLRTILAGLQEL